MVTVHVYKDTVQNKLALGQTNTYTEGSGSSINFRLVPFNFQKMKIISYQKHLIIKALSPVFAQGVFSHLLQSHILGLLCLPCSHYATHLETGT